MLLQEYETYPHPTYSSTEYKFDELTHKLYPYGQKNLKNIEGDIFSVEKTLLINRTLILYLAYGFGDQQKKQELRDKITRSIAFWQGSLDTLRDHPEEFYEHLKSMEQKFTQDTALFLDLKDDLLDAIKLNKMFPRWEQLQMLTKTSQNHPALTKSLPPAKVPQDFVPIQAGEVKLGYDLQLTVPITESFEVAPCPISQRQWVLVMGENPSQFKQGEDSITLNIGDHAISLRADHPVENISWNDLQEFLTRINKLVRTNNQRIFQIFPDHRPNTYYRLLTEAERNLIISEHGKKYDPYHFGNGENKLVNYAHFGLEHNQGGTIPIASKKPFLAEGNPNKKIFDLHGLVWEWVSDWYAATPKGNAPNYQGPSKGEYKIILGGGWSNSAYGLRSELRYGFHPDTKKPYIGSRLARVSQTHFQ